MRNHLKEITSSIQTLIQQPAACVLDIGCNDGTLLGYYPESYKKYGIDPSDVAQEVKGAKVVQDIFPSSAFSAVLGDHKLDAVTSIAMFYDLENPVAFVEHIKEVLTENGVWVFEMSYMPRMLELDSYDTICHEHLEYYSLAALEKITRLGGMRIFRISFNEINGGSIRCYATHRENTSLGSPEDNQLINETRQREFDLELDTDKPYIAFQERIAKQGAELHHLITQLKREGKRIHIYGASTKGNTILQWCKLDSSLIDYAAERNPDKYGARTLGTDIPIISEAESRAMKPDYYLVLPWHFKEEFLEREQKAIADGTGFIFPLPAIDIIKA